MEFEVVAETSTNTLDRCREELIFNPDPRTNLCVKSKHSENILLSRINLKLDRCQENVGDTRRNGDYSYYVKVGKKNKIK